MKRLLLLLVASFAAFFTTPPVLAASCSTVSTLEVAKADPNTKPYSTSTSFTLKAVIADCPNKKPAPPPGGLQLHATADGTDQQVDMVSLLTDDKGNVLDTDGSPIKIVFPTKGDWTVKLYPGSMGTVDPLGGSNALEITIGEEAKQKSCGDSASEDDPLCPDSCKAFPVYTGGFKCLSKEQQDEETFRQTTCASVDTILGGISACDDNTILSDPAACGKDGLACSDIKQSLCLKGDDKKKENVKCQEKTDNKCVEIGDVRQRCNAVLHATSSATMCGNGFTCSDNSFLCYGNSLSDSPKNPAYVYCASNETLPTPPPPSPPCATGLDDPTNKYCRSIATPLGELSTDPTGFINSLFTILLSLSGGVALLLIIFSGYQLMISQGNPEIIKAAKERLTSAFIGILFLIFSLVILQVIGVDILNIPGFGA